MKTGKFIQLGCVLIEISSVRTFLRMKCKMSEVDFCEASDKEGSNTGKMF